MKNHRLFLFAVAMLMALGISAQKKAELNDIEKKAQKSLIEFLRTKHYSPSIDSNDQSVCYKKGDILYWITIEGSEAPLLYTMHCKNFKFADKEDKKLEEKREVAEKAANRTSSQSVVKTVLNERSVDFCLPIYAATPEDYQKVFDKSMNAFSKVRDTFDENYKKCRAEVDKMHSKWYDMDTTSVVMVQPSTAAPNEVNNNLKIDNNIEVRVVNESGNVITDYGKSIYRDKCQFIVEKIAITAPKAGDYKIGVKLYTPNNKLLVPEKGATYTTVTTINIPKANKSVECELNKFGSSDSSQWRPGEYAIEFYDGEKRLLRQTINIL